MIRTIIALLLSTVMGCHPHGSVRSSDEEVTTEDNATEEEGEEVEVVATGSVSSSDLDCGQGKCQTACAPGATCRHSCTGGHCSMSCGERATCEFGCTGGHCKVECAKDSHCSLSCPGGHCKTRCEGASCELDCAGGHCGCEGVNCRISSCAGGHCKTRVD